MRRKCFLCGRLETDYLGLERHHIFGGANRQLSEKYGLTVMLCHNCHNEPPRGAHYNKETADYLHRYGQEKAMREQGWDKQMFISIFGRNYLDI